MLPSAIVNITNNEFDLKVLEVVFHLMPLHSHKTLPPKFYTLQLLYAVYIIEQKNKSTEH